MFIGGGRQLKILDTEGISRVGHYTQSSPLVSTINSPSNPITNTFVHQGHKQQKTRTRKTGIAVVKAGRKYGIHKRCRMGRFPTAGECIEVGDESDRSRFLVVCVIVSFELHSTALELMVCYALEAVLVLLIFKRTKPFSDAVVTNSRLLDVRVPH